jgi:hypothetical protein
VDVAEWLHNLGLAQYAEVFAENAVDWDVLPNLTAEDLKEIGWPSAQVVAGDCGVGGASCFTPSDRGRPAHR